MATEVESPVGYVHNISWNPEGSLLAINAGTDSLTLWNTGTAELQAFDFKASNRDHGVSISPSGTRIAAKTVDGIVIWDTRTGHYQTWDLERPYVMSWCPESMLLAAVCFRDNGLVRIFNADNGEQKSLEGHRSHSHSLAWSPDGSLLASGGGPGEGEIRIWNIGTGKCDEVLSGNRSMIKTLAWSPDGKRLAAGSEDNSIRLWAPYTDNNPRMLSGHISQVQSVAWSPDGQRLASTGRGNRLIVWDPVTGLEAFSIDCAVNVFDGGIVRWSPDGHTLAVISEGRVKILDAGPGYAAEKERLRHQDSDGTSNPE
jgi:Tol biopolymer transport system component